jgi:hypothetical protein
MQPETNVTSMGIPPVGIPRDELGVSAEAVEDHCVVMIRHRTRQQHVDLRALRGLDQRVREGVVGRRIRPQQELPLGATPRDQVDLSGKHLPGQHRHRRNKNFANIRQCHVQDLRYRVAGFRPDSPKSGRSPDNVACEQ